MAQNATFLGLTPMLAPYALGGGRLTGILFKRKAE
jgi:hypothetical protein